VVLIADMKMLRNILFFLILAACFSCEKKGFPPVKCSDCLDSEPVTTNLIIKLDYGTFGAPIAVKVYEGNLEDNILYKTTQGSGTEYRVTVNLNKKYTVTASYIISGISYIAVDSATPRVRDEKEQCDNTCYFVYDNVVDLRLKYTK
jgi:hypothetical protein